ncbi:MAG: flagellar basal body P-ring protein FlgI [Proteobacteria bacterium]|nr:flagellar basal body P-ring protein FlgI [Pseudomonadota bacterium]
MGLGFNFAMTKLPRAVRFAVLAFGCAALCVPAFAAPLKVRIKDIVSFEGVRENQLVGYGLVVGLKGTGDTLKDSPYALETMISMLDRLGVNVRDQSTNMKSKNVAAVMVTATLPAFARHGTPLDVRVSAIGTAKDLLGGTLLVTPLMGADGEVYAVAQGPLVTGGFSAEGQSGTSVTKGVPTSARIANGAIVEKEIAFDMNQLTSMRLSLRNPDMTTAKRIAQAINGHAGSQVASAMDPSTVQLNIPSKGEHGVMAFLTNIEQLTVEPDTIAKVVIDEQNGVIVMGHNVRISTVAVSHGNLTIRVTETPQVSQPNPFSNAGTTAVVPRTAIDVNEGGKKMTVVEEGVTLGELVDHLNALGVAPRDMITILRTIKAAGALQAEIEVI